MSKGQSAKRLKEIVRVFTYYGFDFLISSKLPNSKKRLSQGLKHLERL